jgi:hypothetical protein
LVEIVVPGEGPVQVADLEGKPRRTQIVGTVGGDAYTAMVTGRKVQWVLELVRDAEFAGRAIGAFTIAEPTSPDGVYDLALREAEPGEPACDLAEVRARLLELGAQGHTARLRWWPRRVGGCCSTPVRSGLRLGDVPCGRRRPAPSRVHGSDGDDDLVNEHLRVRIDHASGTYSIRTADGLYVDGLGRLSTAATAATRTATPRPTSIGSSTLRTRCVVTARTRSGTRAGRIDGEYTWPASAIGDFRSCSARSDETVRVTVAHHARAARGRAVPAR